MNKDELLGHIIVDPNVQHGKPCIKGTRTPIHVVIEALAMGMDPSEIQREYGPLQDDDIRACLLYASMLADEQEIIPSMGSAR
jgi:uncharacterized protein (DUF433 family)